MTGVQTCALPICEVRAFEEHVESYLELPKNSAISCASGTDALILALMAQLHIAFEQLKKKLNKEGLFDETVKKEIPKYPKRIGVITAKTGAAVKDIITTINRKYPICEILVFSTLVQGDQAAGQIVRQIKHAQKFNLDTLIVGRGGGSIEDLWPFNEEEVARAIYACNIPVISAVGHETDFTISDFVADLRAPTPTAAADLAVPELMEVEYKIAQLGYFPGAPVMPGVLQEMSVQIASRARG